MEEEALPPASYEVIEKVRKDVNLDEKSVKEAIVEIRKWLEFQPHLPKEDSDDRLEHRLIKCKNRMEKTKQSLDQYYALRTICPELMCDWDVSESSFEETMNAAFCIPLPKLTDDLDRITVAGVTENHPDLNPIHCFKALVQILDIQMCEDYKIKDIYVTDLNHVRLDDVRRITLPLLKKITECIFKGFSTRIKTIHYINTPPYAEFLIRFIKSILKNKLAARIHVHGNDLTEFYKHVPKHLLPKEYGGDAGTIQENWNRWLKKMKSYRDWLLRQETLKSDETKRPAGSVKSDEMFGFDGSFRKLTID